MEESVSGSRFVPVLIVPGWKDRARALRHIARALVERGWPPDFVSAIEFEDPFGSNRAHAQELATSVERLRDRTGSARIDVIAHSMGGLAVRHYLARHADGAAAPAPHAVIRRVVFLATPHTGTWLAWLAWGHGAREMRPGSPFLGHLTTCSLPSGIDATCIRTRIDSHVLPGNSAVLHGTHTVVLTNVTHRGLLRNAKALRLIVDRLVTD
jgi:triacylglycerol esterase/lipase EstA (alpha/beta hydrolase family)